MSRKEQLLDQLFVYGNLYDDFKLSQEFSFTLLRRKFPKLSDQQFASIVDAFGGQRYLDKVKAVYDQYFSEQEIQEICSFWSSETGRKLVKGGFALAIKQFHARWAIEVEQRCQRLVEEVEHAIDKESAGKSGSDD